MKYSYKADKDERHVGFIAEDVPDLVASKDRKSLSPMDITAVLTKVVQEMDKASKDQQKIILEQQKSFAEQQKTISDLHLRIAELEKRGRKGK